MDAIAQVRSFNRTVTQQIGALADQFLGRDRTLGASRLLFEIGRDGIEVRQLRARLSLDSGYTSRLLRTLEAEGLIRTVASSPDARVHLVHLTKAGRRELTVLNGRSDKAAASLLGRLSEAQRASLVTAMHAGERLLLASAVQLHVARSEEHTSELQSRLHLVCRLLLEIKKSGVHHTSRGSISTSTLPS